MTDTAPTLNWGDLPESKLELIDGQLVAGNSLAGSRCLLHALLSGWGAAAALPMASAEQWQAALIAAFAPEPRPATLAEWSAWAAQSTYRPSIAPAGPHFHPAHYHLYQRLSAELYSAATRGGFGHALSRDFVMRLGDDAFTPDVLLAGPLRLPYVNHSYLDGPADLVIEVLLPGSEAQDREHKRRLYARGRVPEYWLVDPAQRTVELLRLVDGEYEPQRVESDGRYRPASVPGLAFAPGHLWGPRSGNGKGDPADPPEAFEVEVPSLRSISDEPEGGDDLRWDSLPFEPPVAPAPRRIGFNEFMAWCPAAKFEWVDDRPLVSSRLGTRNTIGMLQTTFGLIEAVRLLPPRDWVRALIEAEAAQRQDALQRAEWWALARRAAATLRQKFPVKRIAVIGDLTHSASLNFWSEIKLVVWGLENESLMDVYQPLYKLSGEIVIDLVRAERATPVQRQAIEREAVDLSAPD